MKRFALEESPSTVDVESRLYRGRAVVTGELAPNVVAVDFNSPATVADEYNMSALHSAVATAFALFDAAYVDDDGDVLHIYVVSKEHDDETYDRLARAEDLFARYRPNVAFEVHLRASRGRTAEMLAPSGALQVHARR